MIALVLEDQLSPVQLRLEAANTLQVLARRQSGHAFKVALQALCDEDTGVQSTGQSVLKEMCSASTANACFAPELSAVANRHKNAKVRAAAMELIPLVAAQDGFDGIAVASTGLEDIDEEVNLKALEVLRQLWSWGDHEAVATLMQILQRSERRPQDGRLRCEALDILKQVASGCDTAAVVAAAELLNDADFKVQQAAEQTVKQLTSRGNEEVVAALLSHILAGDRELRVQLAAIELLGYVANPTNNQAVQVLCDLKSCDCMQLKDAAVRSLNFIQ